MSITWPFCHTEAVLKRQGGFPDLAAGGVDEDQPTLRAGQILFGKVIDIEITALPTRIAETLHNPASRGVSCKVLVLP